MHKDIFYEGLVPGAQIVTQPFISTLAEHLHITDSFWLPKGKNITSSFGAAPVLDGAHI